MTIEAKEQTWTNPKLSAAVAALNRARQRHNLADTIRKRRLEDRATQRRIEGEIRSNGLEPVMFDPFMPAIDQARYQGRLVRVHVSDTSMEVAEQHYAETLAELEAAQKAEAAARKLKKVKQSTIRARAEKIGAEYQVVKHLRLGGVDYWPGELLPPDLVDLVGFMKVDDWQRGRPPTIRRID